MLRRLMMLLCEVRHVSKHIIQVAAGRGTASRPLVPSVTSSSSLVPARIRWQVRKSVVLLGCLWGRVYRSAILVEAA